MNKEKLNLLEDYIKYEASPLLIENIYLDAFDNQVIIKSNIDKLELNGHYEREEFCPPLWYKELIDKSKINTVVLIIENINEIPLEEQTNFIEILKYKKVSTFNLPKNCLIIATYSDLTLNKINEEVYSLLTQI